MLMIFTWFQTCSCISETRPLSYFLVTWLGTNFIFPIMLDSGIAISSFGQIQYWLSLFLWMYWILPMRMGSVWSLLRTWKQRKSTSGITCNNSEVQIWLPLPLPLPFPDFETIWLVNRIGSAHLIGWKID